MRVITGSARGVRLHTPDGFDIRPTTDKVKESVFSIIQFDIEGCKVLDLFAGSGQLGIEALSRGALSAVFIDASRKSLDLVNKNLVLSHLLDKGKTICSDYSLFIDTCRDTFDIIFLDPPYDTSILQRAVSKSDLILNPYGIIVCEHSTGEIIEPPNESYTKKIYKYGKTSVTVFRKQAT